MFIFKNMDLDELKLQLLKIDKNIYGKIFTFVDFGNVNKWFEEDVWGLNGDKLKENTKLIIDIIKLGYFVDSFSTEKRFYYGLNQASKASIHITALAKNVGFKTIKKNIQ